MHDYPLAESLHFGWLKVLIGLTGDPVSALNVYYLLTFPLAALAALFVFRHFQVSYGPALVGSLLFAFLPYHFLRGEAHLFLSSYYLVPLLVLVTLWLYRGEGPLFRWPAQEAPRAEWLSGRTVFSVAVCLLVSSAGIYYAFFGCFFLTVAGLVSALNRRSLRPLAATGLLVGAVVVGGLANMVPYAAYQLEHGASPERTRRNPREAELYGLKVIQLIVPVTGHRISWWARLKEIYNSKSFLVTENDMAALGVLGSLGFLALLARLLRRRPAAAHPSLFEALGTLNVSAVLLATIGGLGAVVAMVFPWIRGYNRISVYIGFFALFAVVLALEAVRRRTRPGWPRLLFGGGLGLLLVLGVLDQAPRCCRPDYAALRAGYEHDARFVSRIEAAVPPQGLVFQLPYMTFPERGAIHAMPDYDHLRCLLHSRTLRWSYGSPRGRVGDLWQRTVAALPPAEMVQTLACAGWSGVYLNRNGFPDGAARLEAELTRLLARAPLVSEDGILLLFPLTDYAAGLRREYGESAWRERQEQALCPVLLHWVYGFGAPEGPAEAPYRWCGTRGELHVHNLSQHTRTVELAFACRTRGPQPAALHLRGTLVNADLTIDAQQGAFRQTLAVPPGKHVVSFTCDAQGERGLLYKVFDCQCRWRPGEVANAPPPAAHSLTKGDTP
jgi:phosphoglycerol transferase